MHHASGTLATRSTIGSRATAATFAACVGLVATMFASPAKAQSDEINGLWLADNGKTVIEVATCIDKVSRLCGTVVYEDGAAEGEIGQLVLKNFKRVNVQGRKRWESGKVASLEGGKPSKGNLNLLEDGTLKVSSCKRSNRCSATSWTRPSAAMAARASGVNGSR
jgi:uncharacterized protein (DUF2147 family)